MVREYQTNNPFALCRQMDISVLYADLPRQVKGFFTNVDGFKMVYLNSRLPEWEQRMVCAHELGHAVLHEEINALFISYHTNPVSYTHLRANTIRWARIGTRRCTYHTASLNK